MKPFAKLNVVHVFPSGNLCKCMFTINKEKMLNREKKLQKDVLEEFVLKQSVLPDLQL